MKLSEVFERSDIHRDDKARRVLNTSNKVASITADEIENGVTLERLENIGVPVYRYSTQLTIHGKLPDITDEARPAGFKSVFRNGNGTIGVRYVAIDAKKKELLVEASRYGNKSWSLRITSSGLDVYKVFRDKDACIQAFRDFPHDLFYGSMTAAVDASGQYVVFGQIGAIPEANLWKLIDKLTGIHSKEVLDAKIEAETQRLAEARKQREADREKEIQRMNQIAEEIVASMTQPRLTHLDKFPQDFLRVQKALGVTRVLRYTFKKNRNLVLYAYADVTGGKKPIFSSFHLFNKVARARIEKSIGEGMVFKAEPLPQPQSA